MEESLLPATTVLLAVFLALFLRFNDKVMLPFHALRVKRYFSVKHRKLHRANVKEYGAPNDRLPEIGEVWKVDFRSNDLNVGSKAPMRVMTWNLEFGYRLADIIAEIQRVQPAILILQEVDMFVEKESGRVVDVFASIAKACGMAGAFVPHHLYHNGGRWGNAVLSIYPVRSETFFPFNHIPFYGRSALSVEVDTPHGAIAVYGVHLEVCCGISHRVTQLGAILAAHEEKLAARENDPTLPKVVGGILGGDLNTFGHGIVRLSPAHCTDALRVKSLGSREAEWWERNIFSETHAQGRQWRDPFDKAKDITLDNVFVSAKADWLLFHSMVWAEGTCLVGKGRQSDHYWLAADVLPAVDTD